MIVLGSFLLCLLTGCERSLFYLSEPTPTLWVVNAATIPTQPAEIIEVHSTEPTPKPTSNEFNTNPTETLVGNTTSSDPVVIQNQPVDQPQNPEKRSQQDSDSQPILYYTQAGDTLDTIAIRFGVWPEEIQSSSPIIQGEFIPPQQLLIIPDELTDTGPNTFLLPDSEIVNSPSAIDFNVADFVNEAGGFLSTYKQSISDGTYTGAEIVERVAFENSINPRLLLAILEYQSNWVYGKPVDANENIYPIGLEAFNHRGLYRQLSWAVQHLSVGYYGWRAGLLTAIEFQDGSTLRMAPELNAGSVALQNMMAKLYTEPEWEAGLYSSDSLVKLYEEMFGNPWFRAQTVEPLYPPNIKQPELVLPFRPGYMWSLTGGPHSAWGPNGALAAIDFAPSSTEHGCALTDEFVTAAASGLVVRSGNGVVLVDLDGDGHEQTGWSILYMHIAKDKRVPVGTWVNVDEKIGHPSCEGGTATGTHLHIARKYNGEWMLADSPVPMVFSGWTVKNGYKPYQGSLVKDDQIVISSDMGEFKSRITR